VQNYNDQNEENYLVSRYYFFLFIKIRSNIFIVLISHNKVTFTIFSYIFKILADKGIDVIQEPTYIKRDIKIEYISIKPRLKQCEMINKLET